MTKEEFVAGLKQKQKDELNLPDGNKDAARIKQSKKDGTYCLTYPWLLIDFFYVPAKRRKK